MSVTSKVYNGPFQMEHAFTEAYIQNLDKPIAIREAHCQKTLGGIFTPIQDGDLFAGRIKYGLVSFGYEDLSGGSGGYGFSAYNRAEISRISEHNLQGDEDERIYEIVKYWQQECVASKCKRTFKEPADMSPVKPVIASAFPRIAGIFMNFDKLVQIGLPGLVEEANAGLARSTGDERSFFEGMLIALDHVKDVMLNYAKEAKDMAGNAASPKRAEELTKMSSILESLTQRKPDTLWEALQLVWLYAQVAGGVNYGRMDVYMGDIYARDIDAGILTEDEALNLLISLWNLIVQRGIEANGRIVVGGLGRRNEANADRFALLAMEATRQVIEVNPCLTLRFYEGMNPVLMEKALDVIGEGRVHPTLYNDDINVPAVQNSFGIPPEDAEHYVPLGCGEYVIDHRSLSSPNCLLNTLKALESVLHNGKCGKTGSALGLETGELDSFATFDDLFAAYTKQIEFYSDVLARRHASEYEVERENCAFLLVSALYGQCMEIGRSIVDGGVKYCGGEVESFSIVNTGDSLFAIKKLVYEDKRLTLKELVAMLDGDFVGYEKERQMLLNLPKYGNDEDEVDQMVSMVSRHLCEIVIEAGKRAGLHHFLIVNINNSNHVTIGYDTAASADGRKSGSPLANGNTPTAGMDKNGVTAFLNSIVKPDPTLHAGYVHNMKFTKNMFKENRSALRSLLMTYFANGGQQAMVTVISKDDLQNAMREPEKYQNLIVRVGGFCARYVELHKDLQLDILNRTLY